MHTSVLIVGAGPAGLSLALYFSHLGIDYRIIEKRKAPNTTANAILVNARTLEIWKTLGFAQQAIKRGIKIKALCWYRGSTLLNQVSFSHYYYRPEAKLHKIFCL